MPTMVKGWPLMIDHLAQRDDLAPGLLGRAEQFVADAGADDADGVGVLLVEVGEEAAMLQRVEIHLQHGRRDADALGGLDRFCRRG